MSDVRSPENILIALVRLEDMLPGLVGEQWATMGGAFGEALAAVRESVTAEEARQLTVDLLKMLKPHGDAFQRLNAEVEVVAELRRKLTDDLQDLGTELGLTDADLTGSVTVALQAVPPRAEVDVTSRHIWIRPGGLGGATSLKLKNIDPGPTRLATLGAGVVMTGSDILANPHPLVIAAGLLLTISSLAEAATRKIEEREASVFWGLIKARDDAGSASEEEIRRHTNTTRKRLGLKALDAEEVRNALHRLSALKSAARVSGQVGRWRITESFSIKK